MALFRVDHGQICAYQERVSFIDYPEARRLSLTKDTRVPTGIWYQTTIHSQGIGD